MSETAADGGGTKAGEAALARMRRVNPQADPRAVLPDVPPERVPRHVAIIMDGNGRWAEQRGFPRAFGHRNGAAAVRATLEAARAMGVEVLTLYSFSSENWRRPEAEIGALMELCIAYCRGEGEALMRENIRVRVIGRRDGLPAEVVEALDALEGVTAGCTGPTLCLAINYGARDEIVRAARALAADVASGAIEPGAIDEAALASRLDTAGLPDPDLLIRTGGQLRVSNYLLWQISYAEIVVTDVLWPDFGAEALGEAVREFAKRSRRFGGLDGAE